MSGATAYRLRKRPGAESFAAAWDKLLRESRKRALDQAMEKALVRGVVPRTYRGLFVGLAPANNQRMILAALRATRVSDRVAACAASRNELAQFLSGKGHE